jgi:hypothetical protein
MREFSWKRQLAADEGRGDQMAETSSGGGTGGLSFIVGGLVVAVGLGAFVYFGGYLGGHHSKTTTEQTTSAPEHAGGTTTTTTTEKTH